MKKQIKKSRELRIYEAAEALQKAIELPLPDLQIALYGLASEEFAEALKKFREEYEKYIGRKPIVNYIIR